MVLNAAISLVLQLGLLSVMLQITNRYSYLLALVEGVDVTQRAMKREYVLEINPLLFNNQGSL